MFNMFSGGALSRFTIFALGIMPYISASIIMQLMTTVSPQLEQLRKEGESGRRKITQYTRYGTLFLALFQATGISIALESQSGLVLEPGLMFRITAVTTLVTGTMFLMWLGEQITERGLGQRHLDHHLRRHRRGPAERHRRHAGAGAHRLDAPAHGAFHRHGGARGHRRGLLSSSAASARSWSTTPSARSGTGSTAGRARTCRSSSTCRA
jgi:hypothetical protein